MANNYWREREMNNIEKQLKNDARIAKRIKQKQLEAMKEIQKEIEAFYGRYADKEGISMKEARKRVKKLDIKEYSKKAKEYVKERNFTKKANEEMRIYNLTMKVNRLQLLKLHIQLELAAMTSDEELILQEEFTLQARQEYERQAGILGESLNYNEKHIESIVNASFLNATWSERLWADQNALRTELDKLLHRGIVQGKNPRVLARELRKTFDSSIYNSERLLRTEMARIQTDVFQDSLKQTGISKYEWIAERDACPLCKDLDGKIFNLKDAKVGINAVPRHPHCRCSQAAYISREEWDAELKARGL